MKLRFGIVILLQSVLALSLPSCGSSPATNTPPPSQPTAVELGTVVPGSTAVPTTLPSVTAGGLQLEAQGGDTVITLTWTAVGGASGYFVYRDSAANPLNAKPITSTTFEDIGLTNGRTYTYTVSALGSDGKAGSPSAPVTAVPKSH